MLTIPLDERSILPQLVDRTPVFVSPLPSLTTVRVQLGSSIPTPRLAHLLSSIDSAPKLCTVVFACKEWLDPRNFTPLDPWSVVDEWLAHLAMAHTVAGGRLEVVLSQLAVGFSGGPTCFPEFRKAGGKLRGETLEHHVWDLMTTSSLS